ncbi:MAG: hypothetical protein LBC92_02545 [Rickettsiales bacterium]|jgi:hypothetical protein|nr:hypothetical protein [Rickettsiales bacterium]
MNSIKNVNGFIPNREDFIKELQKNISSAVKDGLSKICIKAGDLHERVGGYRNGAPPKNHRMPICCSAMRKEMQNGDNIIYEPKKGNGARLEIEYKLPR